MNVDMTERDAPEALETDGGIDRDMKAAMTTKLAGWLLGAACAATLAAAPAMAQGLPYSYPTAKTVVGIKKLADIKISSAPYGVRASGYMSTGCSSFTGRLRLNVTLAPDTTKSTFSGSGCNFQYYDSKRHAINTGSTYHGDFNYLTSGKSFGFVVD